MYPDIAHNLTKPASPFPLLAITLPRKVKESTCSAPSARYIEFRVADSMWQTGGVEMDHIVIIKVCL